jgi:beta-galactosidase
LVDVEAVDKDGERCPTFQKRVDFSCAGPAVWRGGYNSGKSGSINNQFLDLECGINRIAVRSTLQPGTVVVSAKCDGLKPASVSIRALPVNIQDGITTRQPPLPVVALNKPEARPFRLDVEPVPAGAETPTLAGAGRYIISFSYSGPTTIVHVEQNVADGKNIFVDRDQAFSGLPPELIGADWVQAADNDSTYSAVDLMQLAVKAGSVVAIAHDDRLPSPEWLTRQFQRTEKCLKVDGLTMTIFQHRALSDESLTLGSNTDDPAVKRAKAYIVFVGGYVARASAMK